MTALSFSEFVALLYPYCGNGETEADFIVTITDRIMRGHPGRRNKVVNKEDMYQNPMRNKSVRTLQAYFKGNRPISKRDASILYANSEPYKFEEYLRYQCSDNGLSALKADLEEKLNQGPISVKLDTAELCADLFTGILKNLASGKARKKTVQESK